ncbi:hypothetical protein [Candidatus Proelusimicrobium volucris]|uniref:hypothetical protein n=1 Tax=Candidatus Proelusimicrobium volucris TaxID=3416225 RepID=UPI003D0C4774
MSFCAFAYGYKTEYILAHSLEWLSWACERAAAFRAGRVRRFINEEAQLSKIGISK